MRDNVGRSLGRQCRSLGRQCRSLGRQCCSLDRQDRALWLVAMLLRGNAVLSLSFFAVYTSPAPLRGGYCLAARLVLPAHFFVGLKADLHDGEIVTFGILPLPYTVIIYSSISSWLLSNLPVDTQPNFR